VLAGVDTFELHRSVILAAARHQQRQDVVDAALQQLERSTTQ
jgi:hypothetical protein